MATRSVPLDRTAPHSKQAEMAALGAMLFDQRAIGQVIELLDADAFYFEQHRRIFQTIVDLDEHTHNADVVTVSEHLQQRGMLDTVGGLAYLAELAEGVPTTTHATEYALIVRNKALLRRLLDVAQEITASVLEEEGEVQEIVDQAEARIFEVTEEQAGSPLSRIKDIILTDTWGYIEELHKNKRAITGVASGFHQLDEMTTGMQPGDLIILAARPSMGKTSLALNIAQHAGTREQKAVAFFSLEMSKRHLVLRMLATEARIDLRKLQTGYFGDEQFQDLVDASGRLHPSAVYVDDSAALSVLEIRAKCRRLCAQGQLDLVIVDYLQLLHERTRVENRVQEISRITRSLKALARELNVPVIALSQLSRAVEQREHNRPQLADLRESGSIEQDADVVMMLYREEYYRQRSGEEVAPDIKNLAEVIIAKQRNGPTGTVKLNFEGAFVKFSNRDERHREEG